MRYSRILSPLRLFEHTLWDLKLTQIARRIACKKFEHTLWDLKPMKGVVYVSKMEFEHTLWDLKRKLADEYAVASYFYV